jgi:hypothetical protein
VGESVAGDDASYIIEMRGMFVGHHAHVPHGAEAPTGNTMLVVVSATTGQITDMGITDAAPDIAAAGTPTAL